MEKTLAETLTKADKELLEMGGFEVVFSAGKKMIRRVRCLNNLEEFPCPYQKSCLNYLSSSE